MGESGWGEISKSDTSGGVGNERGENVGDWAGVETTAWEELLVLRCLEVGALPEMSDGNGTVSFS